MRAPYFTSLSLACFIFVGCSDTGHYSYSQTPAPAQQPAATENSSVSAIRDRLLSHTPIGSDGTNVLTYVVDDLKPKNVFAYYGYVDALQASRHTRLDVMRTGLSAPAIAKPSDWPPQEDWPAKDIIATFRTHIIAGPFVATWTFDKNDKLVKLDVHEEPPPPPGFN
jgi:hypothetical protein